MPTLAYNYVVCHCFCCIKLPFYCVLQEVHRLYKTQNRICDLFKKRPESSSCLLLEKLKYSTVCLPKNIQIFKWFGVCEAINSGNFSKDHL